ncbi:hypothetical protein FGO68_gene11885 [Halteria grandinella]|uniref:Uncharacterized protein n=1 Tax=Halteria grandinella TaxID=5974 RepID=A0A8J8T689_HALGN|nr:hypothetical protein FGO68_gene11885 [Halteria grandinella]
MKTIANLASSWLLNFTVALVPFAWYSCTPMQGLTRCASVTCTSFGGRPSRSKVFDSLKVFMCLAIVAWRCSWAR